MSLTSPIDLSPRPEDKGIDYLLHPFDDPFNDLFDQYLSLDPSECTQEPGESSKSASFNFSFDLRTSTSCSDLKDDADVKEARNDQSQPQPWRDGIWCLRQTAALSSPLPQGSFAQSTLGSSKAAISTAQLLSIEGKASRPIKPDPDAAVASPSSTVVNRRTRTAVSSPNLRRLHRLDARRRQCFIMNSPTKTMRPMQNHLETSELLHNPWIQQSCRGQLQLPDENLPLSPPPSVGAASNGHTAQLSIPGTGFLQPQSSMNGHENHHIPAQNYNTMVHNPNRTPLPSPTPNRPAVQHFLAQQDITSNGPFPGEFSLADQVSIQDSQVTNWMLDDTPDNGTSINQHDDNWWQSDVPQSSGPYYIIPNHYQQAPEDVATTPTQDSLANEGLMIQCDPFTQPPYPVLGGLPTNIQASSSAHNGSGKRNLSPLRSPPLSPASPSSRIRRSSRPSTSRRKSSTSTPRTPKTPKMTAGFVNFTPEDSQKILTGVAPSGSSKTKARREMEAKEKRRKLSEAAERAIKAAGGDVRVLKSEEFLA
ncbi:MAG: hypothetical protein M1834_001358 [Cirrosporium novae-zelandiae]|nr:MAG: hypothetical protein M1834_001358 [Cirrosporium novae-zelandiae]